MSENEAVFQEPADNPANPNVPNEKPVISTDGYGNVAPQDPTIEPGTEPVAVRENIEAQGIERATTPEDVEDAILADDEESDSDSYYDTGDDDDEFDDSDDFNEE